MSFPLLLQAIDRRLRPSRHPRPWDLPSTTIEELFRPNDGIRLDLSGWTDDLAAGGIFDGAVLALFAQTLRPSRIFEIGTGFGRSATLFTRHAPAAEIFTLSLPDNPATGRIFRGQPWASRIHQLEGDSLTFDYSRWAGSMDLVFVDGCHTLPHVAIDTRNALQLCSPQGWIVWHDVAADCPDVIRTLLALNPRPLWIKDTRYAVRHPAGSAP